MKITICNRCKKELDWRTVIKRKVYVIGPMIGITNEYDLCGDCMNDFKRFVSPERKRGVFDNGKSD